MLGTRTGLQHAGNHEIPDARRFPIGAELSPAGARFRCWAPDCAQVTVVDPQDNTLLELAREAQGYHSGLLPNAAAGLRYFFRVNQAAGSTQSQRLPDPVSRFQPTGPLGPSQLVDASAFVWSDGAWPGLPSNDQVYYELHAGTFTREGTWLSACDQLPALAELGITVIELMPVADFPGEFGWGYDVANLFAPCRLYGTPDDLRIFVDRAHQLGLGVILDVVYNHLSSVGERLLRPLGQAYFSRRHQTDWGTPLNFDEEDSAPVRELVLTNVRYWIEEFHLDGFRIDATQALHDDSPTHLLLEIARTARLATDRSVRILGENEPQRAELLRTAVPGGCELDALWNDDFHHSAMVRLTGKREAYYSDYQGTAEELLSLVRWGFLFQGQRYHWQGQRRGSPALDIEATRFVNFVQNHDQVANSLDGLRVHALTSPGCYRAMAALWLLAPQSPLFFQGQEFAASSPFYYFNDCPLEQADGVRKGRAEFLAQFPSLASPEVQALLVDPCASETFQKSKLDHRERERNRAVFDLHRDLLKLRREDPVLGQHRGEHVHGVRLSTDALLLRYLPPRQDSRILLVNFGSDLQLDSVASPLVAPPLGCRWQILWSSDDPRYGGHGTSPVDTPLGWHVPAAAAVLLAPVPDDFQS